MNHPRPLHPMREGGDFMLQMYRTESGGRLTEVRKAGGGCWISLIDPTEEEIRQVIEEWKLPPHVIRDPLDINERSRIEREGEALLVIVDIPIDRETDSPEERYGTIPLGMVVHEEVFITVCLRDNPILQDFIQGRVREFFTYKKTRFVLQLLRRMALYYLEDLKRINQKTDDIEKELQQSLKNKELFTLLSLEKSLVYFMTSLNSNNLVMEKLLRNRYLPMFKEDEDLLEDTLIEIKQALEMSQIYSSILSGMMDAFASVISNNQNNVMKALTSITIILSVPIMLASLYGMNVPLPFQENPQAFAAILFLSLLLSFLTALIFWKKRFF